MIEDKIIEVFKSSGMTRVEFADKLNISNATLSHLASERNKASLDLVLTILSHFPEISTDWLILNKGEMYRTENNTAKLKEHFNKRLNTLNDLNQQMAGSINALEKEINELK